MEILDEDIQTIRDALKDAPEFAKSHFESLVSQWESRLDAEELSDELKTANETIEERDEHIKDLNKQIEAIDAETDERIEELESTLIKVRDWMHDTLVLDRPMTDPRKILREIEDALRS